MYAEYTICFLLRQEFNLTLRIQDGLGTRVCLEGEFADLVLDASGLQLLLSLANPSNLGVSVDNGRDRIVVDVAMTCLNVFNCGNTYYEYFASAVLPITELSSDYPLLQLCAPT